MKKTEGYDKLRGGYYTPAPVANFIVRWVAPKAEDKILEPSCGDGSFIRSIASYCKEHKVQFPDVTGVELDLHEAEKAGKIGASIINSDFFSYYRDFIYKRMSFDSVVGNPPFIRSQNFDEEYRKIAFFYMESEGLNPGRLTNIWIPFLVLSTSCLKENGRLGMVIPAEIMQVDYAAEVRNYLARTFDHLIIVTFKKLLFSNAQQEVVLLLGEKHSEQKGIRTIEAEDADSLRDLDLSNLKDEVKTLDHSTEKWTQYFLSNREISLLRLLRQDKRLTPITELLEVNVGVVSGENAFFLLDRATRDRYALTDSVEPIVGRADQLPGIDFVQSDFDKLVADGRKMFLFTPEDRDFDELKSGEQDYIVFGESQNYHKGYKCRKRKHWYVVPRTWKADAFMLRQVHKYPRIILNDTDAQNTDTLHKIKFAPGVDGRAVSAAFLNSFTLALCEIVGRSYGGGVLTFEPGEVRKLILPMRNAEKLDFVLIDRYVRKNQIDSLLDYTDRILLEGGLGLSYEEVLTIRGIWERLSNRRIGRKKRQQ